MNISSAVTFTNAPSVTFTQILAKRHFADQW